MEINLVLFKKNGSRKDFSVSSNVTTIGRNSSCDLYIPLTPVSRKHCQLNRHQGALKVRDLGSRNGTYVNGERIDEAEIKAGDFIKVGPLTFVLQIDGQPENINAPGSAAEKVPQKEVPTDDSKTDDSDIFSEFDELGELDTLDELGELDDFDPLAESDTS
jgi:pSer/pThr/pTyr-binding forkhead associated (FHA) protein